METNFKTSSGDIKIFIYQNNRLTSVSEIFDSSQRSFNYELDLSGQKFLGDGIRGDDALWIPYSKKTGLKIVRNNKRYTSLAESSKVVQFLKDSNSPLFPKISHSEVCNDIYNNSQYLLIFMEVIKKSDSFISRIFKNLNLLSSYIPIKDANYIRKKLFISNSKATQICNEFKRLKLFPEDEWYKSLNLISGKIIDFHRFKQLDVRYEFPSNGLTYKELEEAYLIIVNRYLNVLDTKEIPKWKGKIYQGIIFDNGYIMDGYKSDKSEFDSYRKLPFIPFNKCKDKNVLDIGSNQGFFSFQASLHGARKVVGLELQKQDYLAAQDIKRLTGIQNVEFYNEDIKKFIFSTDECYELVIMNSVLHQIYPNFIGSDDFLNEIRKRSKYFAFETPLNHPLMKIRAEFVEEKLLNYFKTVRLINVYDAYSSGYRANFICYS